MSLRLIFDIIITKKGLVSLKILTSVNELIKIRNELNKTIGFIPTMGALHNGHLSLINRAKSENEIVIVSIFVNPTQFLEGEDFNKYPRKIEADKIICELAKVDILFLPNLNELYFKDEVILKAPKVKSYVLEGFKRPSHFDGVLQIVLKLFNLTRATKAYFGRKDAQQLLLIKQMVKDLFLNIEVIECDTMRENDGLALSSRNVYLNQQDREKALNISKALKLASQEIMKNTFEVKIIKDVINTALEGIEIDYIEITDRELNLIETIEKGNSIILIAVKISGVRLIDNLWI